jgi:hypothetical protein
MLKIDAFFCFYLAIHTITSILVDAIPFLPDALTPAKKYFEQYLIDYKDPLMINLPIWFKSIILSELIFQIPLMIYLLVTIASGDIGKARTPAIIYSSHGLILPISHKL